MSAPDPEARPLMCPGCIEREIELRLRRQQVARIYAILRQLGGLRSLDNLRRLCELRLMEIDALDDVALDAQKRAARIEQP